MRARLLSGCLAAGLLFLGADPAARAETTLKEAQFTLYEAAAEQLRPPGTVEVVHLLRSEKSRVDELLAEAYPGLELELRAFPMFGIPETGSRSLKLAGVGQVSFVYQDEGGTSPIVEMLLRVDGIEYPATRSELTPAGGSVFFLLGGNGRTYFACVDVWSP